MKITTVKENIIKYRNTVLLTQFCFSILGMALGCFMLATGTGYHYRCNNGAARWLFIAGIYDLVSKTLIVGAMIFQKISRKDRETSIQAVNSCAIAILAVGEFAILIWGSVVVFGAWHTTYGRVPLPFELPELAVKGYLYYCDHTAMNIAVSILIIKWVLLPGVIVLLCVLVCLVLAASSRSQSMTVTSTDI